MSSNLQLFRYGVQFPLLPGDDMVLFFTVKESSSMKVFLVERPNESQLWYSAVGAVMRRFDIERADAMRLLRPIASLLEEHLMEDGDDPTGLLGELPL